MPTEAPPPPEVSAKPTLKPAPQVRAAQKPAAPAPPKPLPHELPAPEQPALTKEAKGTGEKPVSATAAPEATPAAKPQPTIAPKGYVVQLGVFSNPANAIQLQEKLAAHGIKSYTETKLHVGPFKDKAEADQALAKIRALGISAVVVPQH